jgi:hypothetical protein
LASRADAWRLQGAGCERSALIYVYARETPHEANIAGRMTPGFYAWLAHSSAGVHIGAAVSSKKQSPRKKMDVQC